MTITDWVQQSNEKSVCHCLESWKKNVDGSISTWWLYQSRTLALHLNNNYLLLAIVLLDAGCRTAQKERKELREERFCSGSVSYFYDLYSVRTIPGCLLAQHPLPPCVFPTLCVWTVKEIYLKTSGTKASRAESVPVCVCLCVCGWVGGGENE